MHSGISMSALAGSIQAFLDEAINVRRLSVNTAQAYENDLRHFCAVLENRGTNEPLTVAMVRDGLTSIARDPRLSPPTVKRRIAAVRAFLRAIDRDLADATFSNWSIPIQVPRRLPRALSAGDLDALLATNQMQYGCDIATTHLCLVLLTVTGLRVSELCALTLADVRHQTGELLVHGKGARERIVIVTNDVVQRAIGNHIRRLPEPDNPDAPLFLNRRGRRLSPQCLRLRLHDLAHKSGLSRKITPHMFRHTAATLLIEAGVDIRLVQRLLGHASIATTQIYTHVTDVALRNALQRADVIQAYV